MMKSPPQRLPRKPEARTAKVEELVDRVLDGRVRIPPFQRPLKWTSSNVVELFDSLYRGYPIGSLLFYKRPAPADRLTVGPLSIDAPEISTAWWVVDGQQRVTTLTVCLGRSVPIPERPDKQDPFVLYFDAERQQFESPPRQGVIPSRWAPLPVLLDATELTEWVFGWRHRGDVALRQIVFEAGTRLREYPIPLYLIETEDSQIARDIFYRINQAGRPLEWPEVHTALFGGEGTSPSTLAELSEELAEVGMGRFPENRLLTCLLALRGEDPTQSLAKHIRRDPEILREAVVEALPVLRRVLSFLRRDAVIPHLRLLPKSILLDVLTRFFALNADPNPRTRTLLGRWFWRTVFGAGAFDDRTLRRRGISAVSDDEEESVQALLSLVRKERPRSLELPRSFDARADAGRIALLALVQLGPHDLQGGARIDVPGLLEKEDRAAFVKIVRQSSSDRSVSTANRIVQSKGTPVKRLLLERIREHGTEDPVLRSHAISAQAAELLLVDDLDGFLVSRAEFLTLEMQRFGERMAAWDQNDRPSVEHLLAEAGYES